MSIHVNPNLIVHTATLYRKLVASPFPVISLRATMEKHQGMEMHNAGAAQPDIYRPRRDHPG